MQQYRILRLLMVLMIIGLTIFLYISYYANSTVIIHSPSAIITDTNGNNVNSLVKVIGGSELIANDVDEDGSIALFATIYGAGLKGKIDDTKQQLQQQPQQQQQQRVQLPVSDDTNSSFTQYVDINLLGSSALPNVSDANSVKTIEKTSKVSTQIAIATSGGGHSQASILANNTTTPHIINPIDPTKGIRTGDLYEAGYIESNDALCPNAGTSLRLLILIMSAPTHQDARLAIRQTWGHYTTRKDIVIAFMLGISGTTAIEDSLAAEQALYGDLIRGQFLDSYNNLTLKTISMLEWTDVYCSKVRFILKTDDDMFINVPRLLTFIEQHQRDTRTIYGRLAKKWKPIRNKKSKYYVSQHQYYPTVFPQFTTGPAYLMSGDVVHALYTKALNQTYLKLEDVFTTGIVAQLVNVKRVHVNEFLNRRIPFNPCNIRKAISVHMVKSNEQFELWKKLLDTSTKCK